MLTAFLLCAVTAMPVADAPAAPRSGVRCEAGATGAADGCELDALIPTLLDWIAENTDYDVAQMRSAPPNVSFIEAGQHVLCEGEEVVVDDPLRAVYDRSTRQIRIVLPWRITDPFDRSILLHELVHDVQFANRHWYCPAQTEWQAYQLQEAWLAERGVESGFDWLHVYFLSKCSLDVHP